MRIKNNKRFWLGASPVFLVGLFFILPAAQAATGVSIPTSSETGLSAESIEDILTNLLDWLLEIVGVIAIIGFVVSGIMYLVSAGDEEMIKKAKKYMTYCLVGIVVVLGSFVVIKTLDTLFNAGGSSSSSSSTIAPYSSYPSTTESREGGSASSSSTTTNSDTNSSTNGVDPNFAPF